MKKLLVLVLLSFALFGCQATKEGSKCIEITIVYAEENVNDEIEVCTDAEYLAGMLDEVKDEIELEITSSDFGDYVSGLKGFNFETLGISYYWAIYVNGDYGMYGISDQPVEDGDEFEFRAESY